MADQPTSAKRRPVDSLFGENEPPPPPISKRRPVDALFGDTEASAVPAYSVEPPQPVTTVSPPSPVLPEEQDASALAKSPAPSKPAEFVPPPPPDVDQIIGASEPSTSQIEPALPTAESAAAPNGIVAPFQAAAPSEPAVESSARPLGLGMEDEPRPHSFVTEEGSDFSAPAYTEQETDRSPRPYSSGVDSGSTRRPFSTSIESEPGSRPSSGVESEGSRPYTIGAASDWTSRPFPSAAASDTLARRFAAGESSARSLSLGTGSDLGPRSEPSESERPVPPGMGLTTSPDRRILDVTPSTTLPAETTRVEQSALPAPMDEPYFVHLPDTIRQLYQDVTTVLADSPTVGDYCIKLLLEARQSYLKQDYASAEYYVETVEAKLQRSAKSAEIAGSPKTFFLWVWELAMLVGSAILITSTYVGGLTFMGQPLAPEFLILARVVGWGGIGGVIGALYNMPWFFQYREYDPAYNANYFARPLQGLIIGGILFLIVEAGMMAGNVINPLVGGAASNGELPVGPWFLYAFAALAGFKQEYVYQFFDDVLRVIFRLPKIPEQLEVPPAPSKRDK